MLFSIHTYYYFSYLMLDVKYSTIRNTNPQLFKSVSFSEEKSFNFPHPSFSHLGGFSIIMERLMIEGKRSSNIRENSVVPALAPVPRRQQLAQARPSSGPLSLHFYIHHRVHTEWQQPLSAVHFITHRWNVRQKVGVATFKIPFMYSFSGNSPASAPISTFMCL